MTRRAGRPSPGGRDTRADILATARMLFADLGFERTTMRAVATKAGVDVALIYHHFANKDALLVAALTLPDGLQEGLHPLPAGTPDPGRALVAALLELWEGNASLREQAMAMIRTALSHEVAVERMRAMHTTLVMRLISEVVADDSRDLRASLVGAHLSGLLLTRYLFRVPAVAAADPATLVEATGPVVDHYLTGVLSTPA